MRPVQSLETLPRVLRDARSIYVSGCAAEVPGLAPLLAAVPEISAATITGIFIPGINRTDYTLSGARCRSFFMTPALKRAHADGKVDFLPWHYPAISAWLARPDHIDTAIAMVSVPNADGFCSLGVQTDFLPLFLPYLRQLIGVINPEMPYTPGDGLVHVDSFSVLLRHDAVLPGSDPAPPDATSEAVARNAVSIIGDGATLQFGIGKLPRAVMRGLQARRRLRLHSGFIDDSVLALESAGALARDHTTTCGVAIGSQALYAMIDANPERFCFRSVPHTHDLAVLSQLENLCAVNSALQIDLLGQVDAETVAGRFVSGPGGLSSFARGAMAAKNGRSILVINAMGPDGSSRIVPRLHSNGVVTLGKGEVDWVVTEFGAAHIRHLALAERGHALIQIADPRWREQLKQEWAKILERAS